MSSILEALERAENDRKQAEKRSLLASDTVAPGLLQRRSLWMFAGLLVIINLVIWLWVSRDEAAEPVGAAAPDGQIARKAPLSTATEVVSMLEATGDGASRSSDPPLLTEAVVQKAPSSEPPVVQRAPVTPPASASADLEAVPETSDKPSVTAMPVEPASAKPEPDAEKNRARKLESSVATTQIQRADEQVAIAQPPPPPPPSPRPAEKVETAERIPEYWELPSNLQKKLADLKVNIHVYNEDPGQRFVIINMRRYKEGEKLETYNMRLERITREGIIIDHGKGLVKM